MKKRKKFPLFKHASLYRNDGDFGHTIVQDLKTNPFQD